MNNKSNNQEFNDPASSEVFLQLFNPFMIYLNDDEKLLDDELPGFLKNEQAFTKVIINSSDVDAIIQQSSKKNRDNIQKRKLVNSFGIFQQKTLLNIIR